MHTCTHTQLCPRPILHFLDVELLADFWLNRSICKDHHVYRKMKATWAAFAITDNHFDNRMWSFGRAAQSATRHGVFASLIEQYTTNQTGDSKTTWTPQAAIINPPHLKKHLSDFVMLKRKSILKVPINTQNSKYAILNVFIASVWEYGYKYYFFIANLSFKKVINVSFRND